MLVYRTSMEIVNGLVKENGFKRGLGALGKLCGSVSVMKRPSFWKRHPPTPLLLAFCRRVKTEVILKLKFGDCMVDPVLITFLNFFNGWMFFMLYYSLRLCYYVV